MHERGDIIINNSVDEWYWSDGNAIYENSGVHCLMVLRVSVKVDQLVNSGSVIHPYWECTSVGFLGY